MDLLVNPHYSNQTSKNNQNLSCTMHHKKTLHYPNGIGNQQFIFLSLLLGCHPQRGNEP
jgi:hypothetical protein